MWPRLRTHPREKSWQASEFLNKRGETAGEAKETLAQKKCRCVASPVQPCSHRRSDPAPTAARFYAQVVGIRGRLRSCSTMRSCSTASSARPAGRSVLRNRDRQRRLGQTRRRTPISAERGSEEGHPSPRHATGDHRADDRECYAPAMRRHPNFGEAKRRMIAGDRRRYGEQQRDGGTDDDRSRRGEGELSGDERGDAGNPPIARAPSTPAPPRNAARPAVSPTKKGSA